MRDLESLRKIYKQEAFQAKLQAFSAWKYASKREELLARMRGLMAAYPACTALGLAGPADSRSVRLDRLSAFIRGLMLVLQKFTSYRPASLDALDFASLISFDSNPENLAPCNECLERLLAMVGDSSAELQFPARAYYNLGVKLYNSKRFDEAGKRLSITQFGSVAHFPLQFPISARAALSTSG